MIDGQGVHWAHQILYASQRSSLQASNRLRGVRNADHETPKTQKHVNGREQQSIHKQLAHALACTGCEDNYDSCRSDLLRNDPLRMGDHKRTTVLGMYLAAEKSDANPVNREAVIRATRHDVITGVANAKHERELEICRT